MAAKRQEHFEYDRVDQSERLGDDVEGGTTIDRSSLPNARSLTLRLSLIFACVALLIAWGASDRGGTAEDRGTTPPDDEGKGGGPPPSERVGPRPNAEGSQGGDDPAASEGEGDVVSSNAPPPERPPDVFVTTTTVKELHGRIPKSFYDPPEGVSASRTCAARGEERGYVCVGDRAGNGERLARGTALCSHRGRYMFGMDEKGSLVWRDCFEDEERLYYEGTDGDCFFMREDASFVVSDEDGAVKWEKECKFEVHLTPWCLEKPTYDCPYLHLHSEGVLVLNWIEEGTGIWKSKGVKKLYNF